MFDWFSNNKKSSSVNQDGPSHYYYTNDGTMEFPVGKQFPLPRKAKGDGSRVEYLDGQGPSLLTYYSSPSQEEIARFRDSAVQIAMSQIETAVWFTINIGGDFMDCPMNPKYYSYDLRSFPPAIWFKIFLVDTVTNVLKVSRLVPLPFYFRKQLKEAIAKAYQSKITIAQYQGLLDYVESKYTVKDLFNNAQVKMEAVPPELLRIQAQMEKAIATDKFLYDEEIDQYQLYIDRNTVETCNVTRIENLLWKLIDGEGITNIENKVNIGFSGYVDDVREVFEVPEICNFLKKLDQKFPFWFYIMSLKTPALRTMTLCMTDAEMINLGSVKPDQDKFIAFMENHFNALNYLGDKLNIDTDRVSYAIEDYYIGAEVS